MIVRAPESRYEVEVYKYIVNDPEYNDFSEGEKSILYDLVLEVRKIMNLRWDDILIPNLVNNCYKAYKKNKNVVLMQTLANCINASFPNKLAKLEGGSMYEQKKISNS